MSEGQKKEYDGPDRRRTAREDLVQAVVCAIREEAAFGGISAEDHAEQHAFIQEWILEIKAKRDRREKIKTQIFGWAILGALGGIATGTWHVVTFLWTHREIFKDIPK